MNNDIVSKFTNHLKNALTRALCLAVESKEQSISPIHLLWALSTQEGCVAAEILVKSGLDRAELSLRAGDTGATNDKPLSHEQNFIPVLSEEAKAIIEKAVLTANIYEHRYIGTEHLLAGILQTSPKDVHTFLVETKTDTRNIQTNLASVFKTTAAFPEFPAEKKFLNDVAHDLEALQLDQLNDDEEEDDSKTPAIDYFTDDMTTKEAVADLPPLVGRDAEVLRLAKILTRKQKNNPIMVGKPGVGKTAVVEGLAKRIVDGNVPPALHGRKILRLDLASMIAGTMYRGEFESRLRQLVDEITDRPEVILFIDEVHTIMGAGAASGSLDAANMLKPALARGDIRCIGATTPTEFKKYIEPDGALERRFQQVRVREPNEKETRKILTGVKGYYESHHNVTYTSDALDRAVELATRYFPEKSFPDKAIDILDEAGSTANLSRHQKRRRTAREIKEELDSVAEMKKKAVVEERFNDAMDLKMRETALQKEAVDAEKTQQDVPAISIDESFISSVVADMCEIPVEQLNASEQRQLIALAKKLKTHIIGQDALVEQVANAVRRAKLGLAEREQPLTSFLFLGPSGVGKTHLAKTLAKLLFANEEHFLRLDMSEYAEPHTVSKLIGSPAGYVGYREATKLTDFVKQHPHAIVLFDEFEKAHANVHNLLLQILDDGMLTDATGRKINFRNTIIILTTNAAQEYLKNSDLGFSDAALTHEKRTKRVREKLEDHFKPELLNRIRHVCLFSELSPSALERISRKELGNLKKRLEEKGVACEFETAVVKTVAQNAQKQHGARDIHRVIEQLIEHQIANRLLEEVDLPNKVKVIAKKDGEIIVKTTKS